MHRSRHRTSRTAGPLRDAASQADRWTLQIDRLKASVPTPAFADAEAGTLPESAEPVEPAGSVEAPAELANRLRQGVSAVGAPASRSQRAAADDLKQAITLPGVRTAVSNGTRVAADGVDQHFTLPVIRAAVSNGTRAAAGDSNQNYTGAIDWPASATSTSAFVDDPSSAGDAFRAIERTPIPNACSGGPLEANAGGSAGNGQEPAELLTETNQQLELIRQTLEKILAKPGSVVLD